MGIKQLFSIIKDEAPDAIKEGDIKNQFGRKVAIVSAQRKPPQSPPKLTRQCRTRSYTIARFSLCPANLRTPAP